MGTKKNVDMSASENEIKVVKAPENKKTVKAKKVKAAPKKARSKKFQAVRAQLDKTKKYDPFAAIELVKKLSYAKFDATISAHIQVRETSEKVNVKFPHSTGKTINAVIFSAAVLKKIEANNIDFDVLIATPQDMSKLTKHARVLGPKGLMPNPKNGTLTPKPELKKKELEGGKITLKTEKKAPLMAVTLGKISMDTKALVENLQTLIKALKGKIIKLSIAASMSPAVKVIVE